MAPTLDNYEEAIAPLPVKALSTNINGTKASGSLQLIDADQHDLVLEVFAYMLQIYVSNSRVGTAGELYRSSSKTLS
jgi:hypothetical protein